jgi:gas vesicle protein
MIKIIRPVLERIIDRAFGQIFEEKDNYIKSLLDIIEENQKLIEANQDKLYEEIHNKQKEIDSLRAAIARTEAERQYWFDLWFAMCAEFQNTQEVFSKIVGSKGGEELKKTIERWKEDFDPEKHPSKRVKTACEIIKYTRE